MKRLHFLLTAIAATIGSLTASKFKATEKPIATPARMIWAERITEESARTNSRRYEHLLHAKYCHGSLDHLSLPEEAAERQARCAKICGCRYINSLAVWPEQNTDGRRIPSWTRLRKRRDGAEYTE